MKSFFLCLLGLFVFSCVTDARGDITSNISATNDRYLRRHTSGTNVYTNVYLGGTESSNDDDLFVGERSSGFNTFRNNAILPFVLPAIPAGHVVIDANLSFSASRFATFSSGFPEADLYGLNYRTSTNILDTPTLQADYYHSATQAHDPNASLIQDSIMSYNLFTSNGTFATDYNTFNTDSGADSALVSYLNTQYTNGATAGDYALLRLNADGNGGAGLGSQFYKVGSSLGSSEAVLTITTNAIAVPEPSAFLFGSLVCTFLGLRSARRGRDRR